MINAVTYKSPVYNTGALENVKKKNTNVVQIKDYSPIPASFYGYGINKWGEEDWLYNQYRKSLSHDKPLKVMDILKGTDMTPEQNVRFLTKVTENEETSRKFIDEIIRDENGNFDPKKSPEVVKTLVSEAGGKDRFEDWYMKKGGYVEAFQKYGEELYDETGDINELCAFLPNWGPWALRDKFRADFEKENGDLFVHNENACWTRQARDGFTVGEVPPEFENKEDYRNFIKFLADSKEEIYSKKHITTNGKFKDIKLLSSGDSGKTNLLLDDKYVLKFDPWREKGENAARYNELVDAAPDSNYTNALVDYYTNKYSENSSVKLYYYDNLTSSSMYEFAKGKNPSFESDEVNGNVLTKDFSNTFKDLFQTGIRYTDFFNENYVKTKDGIKCIDSGHANYFDVLKPGIQGKTLSLQTKTGFSPLEFHGALAEVLEQ